jgi:cation diffusion facilitator family transporter
VESLPNTHISRNFEYPRELEDEFGRARKIEWITIVYLITAIAMMAAVMSNSQAMKTAWIEDILSLVPPVSFLVASKLYTRPSNPDFPYGYHRVISIAFLISSVALTSLGVILLADSLIKLLKVEHATLNSLFFSGKQIWLGYIMIVVMIYSTIPVMILGYRKLPIAKQLFEKNLFTDARMSKANWLTGFATIAGIAGIGIGWWWADPIAAIVICADILNDGLSNIKEATLDLMNQTPHMVENHKIDPVFKKIRKEAEKESWVKTAEVRFRQEGHVYFGEIFIVPSNEENITEKLEELRKKIIGMNWRVFDVVITLVKNLEE